MNDQKWVVLQLRTWATAIVVGLLFISCQSKPEVLTQNLMAPLLEGMGDHKFDVSLEDSLPIRYFDQAIMLTYGFNHNEAERSFRQVAALEPDHPMAWWGVALVQGPNLNLMMLPDAVPVAWDALQKAQELKANGTQREQDYIDALAKRYAENPSEDRSELDQAYADAMAELAAKYPDDLDAQVLYAEAMMDLHPWDFWTKEGEAQPWTPKILATLENVIDRNPDHPMANHLYIHATEASPNPEKALPSAKRLAKAVPGAGHLVHMPAHTYIRVGMYHEGSLANERAIESDKQYMEQVEEQGVYPLGYVPHNYHFLWATATMEGREDRSLEAAVNTAEIVDKKMMREPGFGTLQHYSVIPLYGYVRFGKWDEILRYPKPADDLLYPTGVWHYARGMSYLGTDSLARAKQELESLKAIASNETLNEVTIWDMNTTQELMQIASRVLEGEIFAQENKYDQAIAMLNEALAIEDNLQYNEPPDWFFPVRHNLGAVMMEANQAVEAEQVYRADLKEFPKNGWALFGLHQSLLAQGREDEAREVKTQFDEAWQYADTQLNSSRILKEEKKVLGLAE
jgi:tetratricopeptide (TPR) repeat protein